MVDYVIGVGENWGYNQRLRISQPSEFADLERAGEGEEAAGDDVHHGPSAWPPHGCLGHRLWRDLPDDCCLGDALLLVVVPARHQPGLRPAAAAALLGGGAHLWHDGVRRLLKFQDRRYLRAAAALWVPVAAVHFLPYWHNSGTSPAGFCVSPHFDRPLNPESHRPE